MQSEVNESFVEANTTINADNENVVMFTPPLDENYWALRVKLSENQALVCFPKFATYGIGFQHEEDWNTNLPYVQDANEIYDHIKHNKGDDDVTRTQCIEAIYMLKSAIVQLKEQ